MPYFWRWDTEIYSRRHWTFHPQRISDYSGEWNRVLKLGQAVHHLPNLTWHLKQIIDGSHESFYTKESGKNARYWGFGSLFGWQQDEYDVHKFGYYFQLLSDILQDFGFDDIIDLTNQPDSLEKAPWHLEVSATKKTNVTSSEESVFNTHFDVNH